MSLQFANKCLYEIWEGESDQEIIFRGRPTLCVWEIFSMCFNGLFCLYSFFVSVCFLHTCFLCKDLLGSALRSYHCNCDIKIGIFEYIELLHLFCQGLATRQCIHFNCYPNQARVNFDNKVHFYFNLKQNFLNFILFCK